MDMVHSTKRKSNVNDSTLAFNLNTDTVLYAFFVIEIQFIFTFSKEDTTKDKLTSYAKQKNLSDNLLTGIILSLFTQTIKKFFIISVHY